MKRNFSDITPDRDTDTPDTIIDCDCKNIDSQMQGLIDTISEYITLGNWKVANELIDENLIDINSISSCGNSFLHTAIIHDHLEIVRELLNLEADPDSLSADGLRSLSLSINSCTKNFKAVIKLLLKSGANPNLPNEDHSLPIHFAIQTGSFEIIESLIYFHITNLPAKSILGVKDSMGNNILHYLARIELSDSTSIAQFLISHGDLDVNAVNEEGRTPLHEAAMVGNILMIRELLRYFPDANIRDIYGNRALDLAVNAEVGYILGEYNRLEDQALADFVYSDHPMTSVPSAVFHHEDLVEEDAWIAQLSLAYDREVMLGEMVPSDKFFIDSKPSGL